MGERVVGGCYHLGASIGRGGMGEVFEATGPDGEPVAVKLLPAGLHRIPDLVTRFRREARIAARIESPYVARVFAAGKCRDGDLWIAFERLVGESLDARLSRTKRLPLPTVAWIVEHVLRGLMAAHEVGIVHRDMKPSNIFLEQRPPGPERARILDFGVSKLRVPNVETESPGLTTTDQTLGTPLYMAPEQLAGAAEVDARADLYSVGLVAFSALAGGLPFEGRTLGAVLHHKVNFDALSLEQVTGEKWPTRLEEFLRRILDRKPVGRPASAQQAIEEWVRAVSS